MRTWLATPAGGGAPPPPLPTQAWIDTAFEILGLADGITTAFCGGNVRRSPVPGRKAAFRAHHLAVRSARSGFRRRRAPLRRLAQHEVDVGLAPRARTENFFTAAGQPARNADLLTERTSCPRPGGEPGRFPGVSAAA